MLEITGAEILLIVTAVIFSLIFHLSSATRPTRIIAQTGCGCGVLGALVDFPIVGFALMMAALLTALIVQMITEDVGS